MALPAQFSLLHSEFNAFLFAVIGTEENGSQLSVLSALTRLDLDPWVEGAKLSRLPKEAAARALAALIARVPGIDRTADSAEAAARLVEMLPGRQSPAPAQPAASAEARPKAWPQNWLFWVCLGLLLVTLLLQLVSRWK